MTDGKHKSLKNGGEGPTKVKGTSLHGKYTDTFYQQLAKEIHQEYNKGKKRRISSYVVLEILAILSLKLCDEENGLYHFQNLIEQGKKIKRRRKWKEKNRQ